MRSQLTDIYHMDYSIFYRTKNVKNRRGNPGTRKRVYYKDLICAFDIETSRDPVIEQSWMYIWMFQVDDFYTVLGRTWEEFKEFQRRIRENLYGNTLVVFVHNLSYEFSFMKGQWDFSEEDVFCTDLRKVLKVDQPGFEFRCSYFLANMSLGEFAKRYGKTKKESGERFNYKDIRYPWTPLRRKQRKYCIADVVSLVQAVKGLMKANDRTLYTLPLTQTGFVRNETRKEMKKYNHNQLYAMLPDGELMKYLLWLFRGGNTHSNRFYTNFVLKMPVETDDLSSAYPAEAVLNPKPMTEFVEWTDERAMKLEHLVDLMTEGYALIIHFVAYGVCMRDPIDGFPYIPRHKCKNLTNAVIDNGRVVKADFLEFCCNDQDFRIMMEQYDFDDIRVEHLFSASYKPLPCFLTDYIINLYHQKTALKGVDPLAYMISKERINCVYGMMVQSSQFRDSIKFRDGGFYPEHSDLNELVRKYNRKAFLNFAWGCWITSGTRLTLQRGLNEAAKQHKWAYYTDTDSIKHPPGLDLSGINNEILEKAKAAGAYAEDKDGKVHYMGLFEKEDPYSQFITMGAKKYAYIKNGKIGVTVAGVGKEKGAMELARKGGLEAFKAGFTFTLAGGTEAVYNDNVDLTVQREGHSLRIRDNVVLRDSTYTLGLTAEYERMLDNPVFWADADSLFD